MRVLVTGAAGMIGRRVVAHLLDRGATVAALDVRPMPEPPPSVSLYECDLLDGERTRRALSEAAPTHVVHLAARTDLGGADLEAYRANFDGTRNLMDAAAGVAALEQVVFTSTQLVCRVGHTPRHDTEFCPDTHYGASKVRMEELVRGASPPFRWCITRPTTVWGPGMSAHYRRFFRLLRRGLYFHVGRKPLYKSYGYVGNVAHQYAMLLGAPPEKTDGRVFYLADYAPIELRAWIERFREALHGPPIPTVPLAVARALAMVGDAVTRLSPASVPFTSFRLRNILTQYSFDLGATEEVCGALPYTLDEGVEETVRWLDATA